jgi:nucleotide-binding universal stress UspA family protein
MIKDILVHLDGSREDAIRLAYADQLAGRHQAFLTGLYCNIVPDIAVGSAVGVASAQAMSSMQAAALDAGSKHEAALEKRMVNLEATNDLRRIDVLGSRAGQALAAEARTTDLFVATRPYDHPSATPELLEEVLFNSGRGCLFVPPGIAPQGVPDTVVVAWRNTREAARAVCEAMPILRAADKVIVVMVVGGVAPESQDEMPGADIARHLDRHGVNVELNQISGWSDPAEALLNEVEKAGAKLLVMGGYGHSRFREWILGGVTRDILRIAEVPVLLAH